MLATADDDDDDDDNNDMFMTDGDHDDVKLRTTKTLQQLTNSSDMNQEKEDNNLRNEIIVDFFEKSDVSNLLSDEGKVNFPFVEYSELSATQVIALKSFPLSDANTNIKQKVPKVSEYKSLEQLHTDLSSLWSCPSVINKARAYTNFPLSLNLSINSCNGFPCNLEEEYEIFDIIKTSGNFDQVELNFPVGDSRQAPAANVQLKQVPIEHENENIIFHTSKSVRAADSYSKLSSTSDVITYHEECRFPQESLEQLSNSKVSLKKFPLQYDNQDSNNRVPKLTEVKSLWQLQADINTLKSCRMIAATLTVSTTDHNNKFPKLHNFYMANRHYSFPCGDEDLKFIDNLDCSTKHSVTDDVYCEQQKHSFPQNKSQQLSSANVLFGKFPLQHINQNVDSKLSKLKECHCIQQLLADINTFREYCVTVATCKPLTVVHTKFPSNELSHKPSSCQLFPFALLQNNKIKSVMDSILSNNEDISEISLTISDQTLTNEELEPSNFNKVCTSEAIDLLNDGWNATRNTFKFPLLKCSQMPTRCSERFNNELAKSTSLSNIVLPVVELNGRFIATFSKPFKNITAYHTTGPTSINKPKFCFTDISDIHNSSMLGNNMNVSNFKYHICFPFTIKEANSKCFDTNFPLQSFDPIEFLVQYGQTSRVLTQSFQNQNCGHAQEIQVQQNQEHTTAATTTEHSNYYHFCKQEQHIHDAVHLARTLATTNAKNTTEFSSSQNDDVDYDDESNNSLCISGESTDILSSISTSVQQNINSNHLNDCFENNEPNFSSSTPPSLENLELLNSYTNRTIENAANTHRIPPPTSSPCSDVRDSSSQEVPSPLNAKVSFSERRLTTSETRPFLLEKISVAPPTDLVTLPKYYSNNTEVVLDEKELIENSLIAAARVKTNVQNKRQQETEIATTYNIDEAMTLTDIENSENLIEFSSVIDDIQNQQDIVGSSEELQGNEMKLEMKSARGSNLLTNAETSARRYSQIKNEPNLTHARTTTVNTHDVGSIKSRSGETVSARDREIPTRAKSASIENALATNTQRRNSLTGHKIQTKNNLAMAPVDSGNTSTSVYSPRRSSLIGNTTRVNDGLVGANYGIYGKDRSTARGNETAYTVNAPTVTNSTRKNSLSSNASKSTDALGGATYLTDKSTARGSTLTGTGHTTSTPLTTYNPRKSSVTGINDFSAAGAHGTNRSNISATTHLTSSALNVNSASIGSSLDSNLKNTGPKKYNRAPTKYVPPSEMSNDVTRSISLDAVDSALPSRTLLRRQRRMRSQDSYDEPPESTIERLNRLRARISGALSEVKGVLKHYSTDVEEQEHDANVLSAVKTSYTAPKQPDPVNVATEIEQIKTALPTVQQELPVKEDQPDKKDQPVSFRFVKVVRRRSIFDEEDEDREKEKENDAIALVQKSSDNDIVEHLQIEEVPKTAVQEQKTPGDISDQSSFAKESTISKNDEKIIELLVELKPERNQELQNKMLELMPEDGLSHDIIHPSAQNSPKSVPEDYAYIQCSTEQKDARVSIEVEERKAASETEPEAAKVTKAKKKTSTHRRASIAAVESSKIEPTIKTLIPEEIIKQRRPSDSEAILKKKSIKVKTSTITETPNDETTPKVKLINKVKRPSLKRANIVTTETITNAMTDFAKSTPASIIKNNNNSSNSGEMQANNSNKDAPKRAAIIAPAAATLATQLVIDDAPLTIGEKTAAIIDDSKATKAPCEAKDTIATSSTTMVSPLRATEQSSQVNKSTTEIQKSAEELLAEAPTIAADPKKSLENSSAEKFNQLKTEELPILDKKIEDKELKENKDLRKAPNNKEASENCKISDDSSSLNANKTSIHQKVILTDVKTIIEQVKTAPENQQVCAEITKAPVSVCADVTTESIESTTIGTLRAAETTTSDALLEPTKATETSATTHSSTATGTSEASAEELAATAAAMPELQVKAAQVFIEPKDLVDTKEPFDLKKENVPIKKKIVIHKKLVRKNSTEKSQTQTNDKTTIPKLSLVNIKDRSKNYGTIEETKKSIDLSKPEEEIIQEDETEVDKEIEPTEVLEQIEEVIEEPPAPEKKKRKIKRKVIIKREQRRLSISESAFFKGPEEAPATPVEDIVEKPIEYVKVASDEEQDYEDIPKSTKPVKSCLKVREFQIGDLVMYAERYRKTQVRWKKGVVLERITSISYKLEIEGKEVPAHISYIKKYTGRKVNFGGKEYLEIDYEQIAEEEEKARTYSIWNMV